MKNKCLYCYKPHDGTSDFHPECSKEFFGTTKAPTVPYSIDQMSDLAKDVVERSVTVPGVQAKLSMTLVNDQRQNSDSRLTVVGALGGNYIFKPPAEEYPEMPQNEHLTMRIAEAFGLKVVPSSLIRLASGELGYVTKRIDRTAKGNKIHMLDMFQVTEAYNKYKSSMEKVGKAVLAYSDNTFLDLLNLFELTLFSFITGNNDMHLKNFSMIESEVGWILAPAYDLLNVTILFPEDTEELALPTDAKKKKLRRSHFEQYGLKMGLTKRQVNSTLERVLQNCKKAHEWIDESFLSNEMKDKYRALLDARSERLQPDNSDLTRVT